MVIPLTKTKIMKLSKPQTNVINLMRKGWELGFNHSFEGRSWLQKNGLGNGGQTEDVNANTFQALYDRKLIYVVKESFPSSLYGLTELGKTCTIEL